MFIIRRGAAEVLAADSSGALRRVAALEPGNVIGEMALFTGEPRRADVRALRELELLEIRKPVVQRLLSANPLLVEAFSRIIVGRQTQLGPVAEPASGGGKAAAGESIIQRIKRFFNLS